MTLNKKQIGQIVLSVAAFALLIIILCSPEYSGKVVGIISMTLLTFSMILSFIAEEKRKNT